MGSAIELDEFQTSRPLSLAEQVETLLARLSPDVVVDRRRDERYPIPILFQLVPLDMDRQPLEAEAKYVVGKNISRRGLSFFHDGPITFRRALVLLDHPGLGSFRAEIDVNWCRFARPGWYESGGRLIRSAADDTESRQAKLSS
jgi:hypothetical protein